ncbi:MAG: hypothetical protein QOE90_1927 [Thermoplasmata archaeon]|jgi:hypothetical protein|nr:hypothetical protein [Thermoplasmata archaeon]
MESMLYGGLVGAAVFGALAANRHRAGWLLLTCLALLAASVPLLLRGVGVFGIVAATILVGVARALPGYRRWRWLARAVALVAAGTIGALQIIGLRRGNAPSMVDWLLVLLGIAMLLVTLQPVKPEAEPGASRVGE